MIAAHHHRRFDLSSRDQIVECKSKSVALSIAQPTDTGGKPLKFHSFLRQVDPAAEMLVIWEHLQHQFVGASDIGRFTGECSPAKWPFPFAEQRPDIGGNKAGKIVSVLYTLLIGERANVVPIVESNGAEFLQVEHALHVIADRC